MTNVNRCSSDSKVVIITDMNAWIITCVTLFANATVLTTVLTLTWTVPDLPKADTKGSLCLQNELGSVECGETTLLLQRFLDLTIKQHYDKIRLADANLQDKNINEHGVRLQEVYSQYYWEMRPAAKLTGKEQTRSVGSSSTEMTTIREWEHGRELYYTQGFERYGVRYRNGRLVVPVCGIYFVYSHVDLFEEYDRKDGIPNITNTTDLIKHAIYKFNILDEEEVKVVDSVQPHTVSSNTYFNSYSSYISGLVELKPGDELSVKVSDISLLKYPNNNYFGVNFVTHLCHQGTASSSR